MGTMVAPTVTTAPSATVQPLPVGQITQGAPLDWHPINTPPGFIPRIVSGNILVPSPAEESDPTHVTAYACDEPSEGQSLTPPHPTFWTTYDGGAHWAQMPLPSSAVGWCNVYPDQTGTQNVLLGLSSDPPMQGPPSSDSYYVSYDGGVSTQAVPSLKGKVVSKLATERDTAYVLAAAGIYGPGSQILASNDGMRTWHVAAPANSPVAQNVSQFWLDAQSGALIAVHEESTTSPRRASIYTSNDGGQSWAQLATPTLSGTFSLLESSGLAGQPWQLCAVQSDSQATDSTYPNRLTCSTDGGKTWQQRASWTRGPGDITVLTKSGAVFGTAMSSGPNAGYSLYELAPFSRTWEQRGPVAQFGLGYSPTDVLLWALPEPMMGSPDPQGRIYVAHAS